MEQTLFLGASISSISASVGWNEQESELTVILVEDYSNETKVFYSDYNADGSLNVYNNAQTTTNVDFFNPPPVGAPVYLVIGDFEFGGILQSWVKKRDINGSPIYEVRVVDPRTILDATEVILNNYDDTIPLTLQNIINAYGYKENQLGFGGAQVNEAGMPW